MQTTDLIRHLSANVTPVRRLSPPRIQAMQWLLIALLSIAVVILLVSPRADLAFKLGEPAYLVEQAAAFATAVTAAIAAFCMVVPGHSRKLALLPVIPLAFWIGRRSRRKMAKPYAAELEKLAETFAWSATADIDCFAEPSALRAFPRF